MSKNRVKEYPSLVWLRRVRAKLAAEYAKGPNSRAVRERQRKVDALIARLGLRKISADAARARPRRPA
ncbi:MAG: hypothetical protein HY002_04460 [Candidatus Rokubacteria bacterium]|nr:hypothetical protein [Candidatus Rokubacteria bacterium]